METAGGLDAKTQLGDGSGGQEQPDEGLQGVQGPRWGRGWESQAQRPCSGRHISFFSSLAHLSLLQILGARPHFRVGQPCDPSSPLTCSAMVASPTAREQ